jgi:hypothetical protein
MDPLIAPILYSETVTASDSADLSPAPCRAILVDVAGDVKVSYASGKSDTLTLAAGIWHPMQVSRVWSTGTTATGLHAGW